MNGTSIDSGASVASAFIARARQEIADLGAPSLELARDVAEVASRLSPAAGEALLSTYREAGLPTPLLLRPLPLTEHVPDASSGALDGSTSETTTAPSLDAVRAGSATLSEGAKEPAERKDGPVHYVQRKLNAALAGSGIRPLVDDGNFGVRTDVAVKTTQNLSGLKRTGKVDQALLAILDGLASSLDDVRAGSATIARGAKDPVWQILGPVHELQRRLDDVRVGEGGVRSMIIDGNFGVKTEAALKSFQRKHGLRPTGVLDRATLAALGAAAGAAVAAELIDAHDDGTARTAQQWVDQLERELARAARDPDATMLAVLPLGKKPSTELVNATLTAARDRFGPSAKINLTTGEGADEHAWLDVRLDPEIDARRQAAVTLQVRAFVSRAIRAVRAPAAKPGAELAYSDFVGHEPPASKLESIRKAVKTKLSPRAEVRFRTISPGTAASRTLATVSLPAAGK